MVVLAAVAVVVLASCCHPFVAAGHRSYYLVAVAGPSCLIEREQTSHRVQNQEITLAKVSNEKNCKHNHTTGCMTSATKRVGNSMETTTNKSTFDFFCCVCTYLAVDPSFLVDPDPSCPADSDPSCPVDPGHFDPSSRVGPVGPASCLAASSRADLPCPAGSSCPVAGSSCPVAGSYPADQAFAAVAAATAAAVEIAVEREQAAGCSAAAVVDQAFVRAAEMRCHPSVAAVASVGLPCHP